MRSFDPDEAWTDEGTFDPFRKPETSSELKETLRREFEGKALHDVIPGISIWVAEKAADGALGPYQWIAIDSNSPYHHSVGNAATVTNVYRGQWFDRLKRMGPFGDPVEVAVTA